MEATKEYIAKLVVEIQNDNQKAFADLYNLTNQRAYFVALEFVKNEADAQDILQESYIKALTKIRELDKPESFQSWLNQIVANKSKDFLKKKKPMLFEAEENEVFEVLPDEDMNFRPQESLDQNELQRTVMEVLDELSEEKRACVLMMYYEEMSVTQIADCLEIPEGTVKTRLFSARKDLKEKFAQRGITSAFSVAPMGVVLWAMRRASGIAYASFVASGAAATTAAAVGAGATAAATTAATATTTAGGIGAKIAAMSAAQKVVAGVSAVAVVTGATVGTVAIIRNQKEEAPIAIVEEIEWTLATADMLKLENGVIVGFTEELEGNIEIPETIDGEEIDEIASGAFQNCDVLTAVKLPESLMVLRENAFLGCDNLKEVCFTSAKCEYKTFYYNIGPFEGCNSIEKFVFSKNVTKIPVNICKGLSNLKTVVFKGKVTEIGAGSFSGCVKLATVDLSNVEKIGENAFADSGLKSVDFSDKLTEIASGAFANCEELTAVKLPESLMALWENAFLGCINLKEVCFTSAKCEYRTFYYNIGPFEGCNSIEKFVFSKNVTKIPVNICKGLSNLKTVVFEGDVTEIGASAFSGCENLESVTFNGTQAEWNAVAVGAGNEALKSENITFNFSK